MEKGWKGIKQIHLSHFKQKACMRTVMFILQFLLVIFKGCSLCPAFGCSVFSTLKKVLRLRLSGCWTLARSHWSVKSHESGWRSNRICYTVEGWALFQLIRSTLLPYPAVHFSAYLCYLSDFCSSLDHALL